MTRTSSFRTDTVESVPPVLTSVTVWPTVLQVIEMASTAGCWQSTVSSMGASATSSAETGIE